MRVRPFEEGDADATVSLLYDSSGGLYDRYAGTRRLAERAIAKGLTREGTSASPDVVWVVEVDDGIAAAMAAMPWSDWPDRARAFLRVTFSSIPPWRWPRAAAVYRASGRGSPAGLSSALYIDSLATDERYRRQGAATALIDEAERLAHEAGLNALALDTWAGNTPARKLYRKLGFIEIASTPPTGGLPGGVSLVKEL